MGQHTWFNKDRKLYEEEQKLWEKEYAYEIGEIYLDDLELLNIYNRTEELYKLNKTDYHDIFRTDKRNDDGTYTDDVIYSKKECDKWLENNNIHLSKEQKEVLDNFWEEYPNGVIHFG